MELFILFSALFLATAGVYIIKAKGLVHRTVKIDKNRH